MRRILGVIIFCFVLATAYIAYVIAERQTALQKFSRYNDSWSIGQTVSEYMRLEHVLSAYALDPSDDRREEARLRLDIMLGRLELLQQGNLRAFIQDDTQRRALFLKLSDILHRLDAGFDQLNDESLRQQLQAMAMLDGPMTALASAAVEYDVGLIDTAQAEVRQLHLIYTGLAAGLILCGVVLVLLLLRHNKLLDRAHGKMQRLTNDLQEATGELQSQNYRLEHDAHHDALTGLPNRVLFRQDLEERLRAAQSGLQSAIILLLDLDGFKDVNDTLGHDVGDALLQAVASRLAKIGSDGDVVCRLGGDEFALLTTGIAEADALALASDLMEAISRPYLIGELEIKIGTCVGVAISQGEPNTEELFKHADLALYEAKALGPGHASLFRSQMQTRLRDKKSFEADLQKALLNGEMTVFYQPQARTDTREICGYEALVRWNHPVRGAVSPMEFIPVAERIGFINSLGDWVLKTACLEAVKWTRPLKIAVNLSPVQFRNPGLIEAVTEALEQSGLDAERLELEITESVLLDKNEQTLNTLRQLKALSIQIAMDDFGTGYSSLGSLSGFPFDKIKIDRSFVRDVTTRLDALAIVELVTGVGRSLKMTTIAEGIETEEQFECLKRLGCDQVQGYLIGKPVPASELRDVHQKDRYDLKAAI
ncbi:EAL domain-containing protein [Brucella pseudogrignonensis]|uniref:putative bifunctional diguanylate cyclase/phosphodiesterase n=1 Tax=Brucella pseudogrignonensis TaxID=419475 RepID=UPI00190BBE5B|nr:EAL domain-containing protein [Brucella pseudogrignonensis]MBK0023004.1 EAL domain-containing protein [Ochrobactrum sp. S45]MBK0045020.1 EAL domain-containing protein [Ochrobactrum sp. S46]UKK95878.1 EAL domain-containing protein [Brucella pseudogrignonensis]